MVTERNKLVKAAKELNKALGLADPEIDIEAEDAIIQQGLLLAKPLIEEGDQISEDTLKILEALETELEEEAPEDGDESTKSEEEESEMSTATKKKVGKKKAVVAAKKVGSKSKRRTKKAIIIELTSSKNGATIDRIAQKIVDEGVDSDFEKSKRVSKQWLSLMGFKLKDAKGDAGYHFKAGPAQTKNPHFQ